MEEQGTAGEQQAAAAAWFAALLLSGNLEAVVVTVVPGQRAGAGAGAGMTGLIRRDKQRRKHDTVDKNFIFSLLSRTKTPKSIG